MWAIFPIQDFFGFQYDLRVPDPDDEKINEPSNPKHYWRYRMHVTLEHIIEHTAFVSKLRGMIAGSGR
jgi:4-alpha-glucanotransferase